MTFRSHVWYERVPFFNSLIAQTSTCPARPRVSQPWSPDSDVIGLRLEPRQEHVHAAQFVRTDNPLFDKVVMAFSTVVDEVKQLERTVCGGVRRVKERRAERRVVQLCRVAI